MINISGSDIAAIISSLTALVIGVGTLVQQFKNGKKVDQATLSNVESAKIISRKVDENTALTHETAVKVDEVHAATNVLVAGTGTFRALVAPDK
jgi:TPP-dependent trihydroxycyclohexane-1,2-dione (THcHDO) dehydratase